MSLFDTRTVIFSYVISNLICLIVVIDLWRQNRRRFSGLGFWLIDFIMQFTALVLVALRGIAPDFLTMTVSNAMILGGTILLYIGLERFAGKRGPQLHNYILLAVFILIHAYFVLLVPNLDARNILFSLALLAICSQCAWLLLIQVDAEMQFVTRDTGRIFILFCLISIARLVVDLAVPTGNDFFHSNIYDTLLLLVYQMLFIVLTFSLFLMVNRRLKVNLERDIQSRIKIENTLRVSEDKFQKAFHTSPDLVMITRLKDGKIVEVNDGFTRISEYSREEVLGNSTIALEFWANPQDRVSFVTILQEKRRFHDVEYDFRAKSGKIINGLMFAEVFQLGDEPHIFSVIHDITQRKLSEGVLAASVETFKTVFNSSPVGLIVGRDSDARIVDVNNAFTLLTGYSRDEAIGHTAMELKIISAEDRERNRQMRQKQGFVRDLEIPIRRKSGESAIVLLSSEVIYLNGEKCVLTTLNDITARKQAEKVIQLRLKLWEYAAGYPFDEFIQETLDEISELTGSPIGLYYFVEKDQNAVSLQAESTGASTEFFKAERSNIFYPIGETGAWANMIRERKPVIHNNYAASLDGRDFPNGRAEVLRELVVPTVREGEVVAILRVGNKPSDYSAQDVALVSDIADLVWAIIEQKRADEQIRKLNIQLERLAMMDDLTGLPNRRFFFLQGTKEINSAQRYNIPFSLLMLDVDKFKSVNDRYGHEVGDLVLKHIARTLDANVRGADTAARLGGEEFSVLLPNTEAEAAVKLAERIRSAIEQEDCVIPNQSIKVTVSIGVASYNGRDLSNLDVILRRADVALYQAKNEGRNRVVLLN